MRKSIEELALEKEWVALQPDEQAIVLANMDQSAYQQLRELLQGTKEMDAMLQPPSRLRENLLKEMERKASARRFFHLLDRKIPLWQAAAAMLVGIVLTGFLKPKAGFMDSPPLRIVQVRDTLVQEKMVWKERILYQTKVVYRDRDTIQSRLDLDIAPKGVSLGDAPELMSLFTQAEK